LSLVTLAQRSTSMVPAASDTEQRARVAVDVLLRAIRGAGAGIDGGPERGALSRYLPSVVPRRLGPVSADPPQTARADVVTVISVPAGAPQGRTTSAIGAGQVLSVATGPGCLLSPLCGLAAGRGVLAFDPLGDFDVWNLADTAGNLSRRLISGAAYAAVTPIAGASVLTFYWDAANHQLREYDADQTDTPVVDHVSQMTLEYFGNPAPPTEPRPPAGVANCLYDASGVLLPRPVLSATDGQLAALPLSLFSDGPWCGGGATAFDADLLRVRAVRVTLHIESASGLTRGTWRAAPDVVISFVVTLRNVPS
jgi:hypothetical protein